MKNSKAYYHNGLFRFLEGDGWPDRLKRLDYAMQFAYDRDLKEYEKSLQSALDKSIPYEDQELIKKMVVVANFGDADITRYENGESINHLLEHQVYEIPEIEVIKCIKRVVARIVPQSSEPPGNPDRLDKPDFKKFASDYIKYIMGDHPTQNKTTNGYVEGCKKIWNEYVVPLKAGLENERTNGRQEWERLQALEIDRLKSELDKAVELLQGVGDEKVYSWQHQCKINDFLKDKK